MDRDRQSFTQRVVGHGAVEGIAHGVRRVGGNTEAHVARGQRPESAHRLPQLSEALTALRGIGPEHLLIVDPPSAQSGERLERRAGTDRKSTRLNSSHRTISYAVFCLKKK